MAITSQSNFTGIDDGIVWDLFGRLDGSNEQSTPDSKIHMAWTRPNATVGFLWIDRNTNEDRTACFMASSPKGCNGTPDNGGELFGNISPQQPPPGVKTSFKHAYKPNGAAALLMFDRPVEGGNGDGRITRADEVWPHLGVWFDLNHNGKMDAGENFTLDELGIVSLSTNWNENGEIDQYGNVKGVEVTVETNNSTTMAGYDVWFVAAH